MSQSLKNLFLYLQERRSLHVLTTNSSSTLPPNSSGHPGNSSSSGHNSSNLTSLDLELDLAAQQSRLQVGIEPCNPVRCPIIESHQLVI
jgi:hypothetical protein